MSIFEWSDSFLLRVPMIDNHHKHLVSLLNATYDSFINNNPFDLNEMEQLINDLHDYAVYHFGAEEQLMRDNDYPHLASHINEHASFLEKVISFKTGLQNNSNEMELKILQFLKDWLVTHILSVDKKFGFYLTMKDVD